MSDPHPVIERDARTAGGAEILRSGGVLPLRVHGASMGADLPSGSALVIEPPARPVRVGEVVLVEDPWAGRWLVHRVIASGPRVTTMGDALARPDPPVPADAVLGSVRPDPALPGTRPDPARARDLRRAARRRHVRALPSRVLARVQGTAAWRRLARAAHRRVEVVRGAAGAPVEPAPAIASGPPPAGDALLTSSPYVGPVQVRAAERAGAWAWMPGRTGVLAAALLVPDGEGALEAFVVVRRLRRGAGLGTRALSAAVAAAAATRPGIEIRARVPWDDERARRMCAASGFRETGRDGAGALRVRIMTRACARG